MPRPRFGVPPLPRKPQRQRPSRPPDGYIVLTSIRAPTRQVQALLRQSGWETVFVADLKTPEFPAAERLHYLSVRTQKTGVQALGRSLPWNHYARKNLGYLFAIDRGSRFIFDTDDDNLPLEPWRPRPSGDLVQAAVDGPKWINVYTYFGGDRVWPRGFPLEHIGEGGVTTEAHVDARNVVVWQGLVDGDPDVDAIFRLTRRETVRFRSAPPLALSPGSYCPFNSQNTLWDRPAFPYLYLPSTVSFRFTDILRGLVAQRCLWAHGWRLGFQGVTARQERNPHDLLEDFKDELPCYLHAARVADILDALALKDDATMNLHQCYTALHAEGIVQPQELGLLDQWLGAVSVGCAQSSVA